MSESIDTEAIRAEWRSWVNAPSHTERIRAEARLARHVPALLDEIGRLRAERDDCRRQLAHADTTIDRLSAANVRLHEQLAEARNVARIAIDSKNGERELRRAAEAKLAAVLHACERLKAGWLGMCRLSGTDATLLHDAADDIRIALGLDGEVETEPGARIARGQEQ